MRERLYVVGFWASASLVLLWSLWAVVSLAYAPMAGGLDAWIIANASFPLLGWLLLWGARQVRRRRPARAAAELAWAPVIVGLLVVALLYGLPLLFSYLRAADYPSAG